MEGAADASGAPAQNKPLLMPCAHTRTRARTREHLYFFVGPYMPLYVRGCTCHSCHMPTAPRVIVCRLPPGRDGLAAMQVTVAASSGKSDIRFEGAHGASEIHHLRCTPGSFLSVCPPLGSP
jgi:hypothetical protein